MRLSRRRFVSSLAAAALCCIAPCFGVMGDSFCDDEHVTFGMRYDPVTKQIVWYGPTSNPPCHVAQCLDIDYSETV